MINLKTLLVGFGFLLAVVVYMLHKQRIKSANKERTEKIKNRKKKKINQRK
jgi:cbb3-type cytochrome oxidase subunit 3